MSDDPPKATGKRYRTTSEMLEDTDTPQEIIDSVKEVESQMRRDAERRKALEELAKEVEEAGLYFPPQPKEESQL